MCNKKDLKKGSIVRIKFLEPGIKYPSENGVWFVDGMCKYRGYIARITSEVYKNTFDIDLDKGLFTWHRRMVDPCFNCKKLCNKRDIL